MGQTLSQPMTEKHTTVVQRGKQYWVGLSDMQGWRISMEDSHSVHLYLPPSPDKTPSYSPSSTPSEPIPEQPAGSTVTNEYPSEQAGNALVGVFDGHGGSTVAKYAGTTLHSRLIGLDSYKTGNFELALKEAFLKTDEDLRAEPTFFNDPSGCTAVVGLLTNDKRVIVANAGDSRAVLGHRGESKALSDDHKPTNKEETSRITAAGGFVEFGRVNGNLALSRAIGDFEFKQNFSLEPERQIVTADPEIITHNLDGEEEFMVFACDGIWDCLSSQQVVDFTRRAVANGDALGKICEDMMTKCLASDSETGGLGCDNMTVVIIAMLGGRTPEEWQQWVKERVDNKVGHDTPESIPDVFSQMQGSSIQGGVGGIGGVGRGAGGFRVGGAAGLANIASILGASGITFRPSDGSDDEEEDDDELHILGGPESSGAQISALGDKGATGTDPIDGYLDNQASKEGTKPVDITGKLDAAPEKAFVTDAKSGSVRLVDDDGDSAMDSDADSDSTTTGNPSDEPQPVSIPILSSRAAGGGSSSTSKSSVTPSFTSIGSPNVPSHQELLPVNSRVGQDDDDEAPQEQLKSTPGGDAVPDVAKVEGLMDTSESPLKL